MGIFLFLNHLFSIYISFGKRLIDYYPIGRYLFTGDFILLVF